MCVQDHAIRKICSYYLLRRRVAGLDGGWRERGYPLERVSRHRSTHKRFPVRLYVGVVAVFN